MTFGLFRLPPVKRHGTPGFPEVALLSMQGLAPSLDIPYLYSAIRLAPLLTLVPNIAANEDLYR